MELEKQVVSLDLSKKLKELGVKQETYFEWLNTEAHGWMVLPITLAGNEEHYSAFTVAELGEMLPNARMVKVEGELSLQLHSLYCKKALDNLWSIKYAKNPSDEPDIFIGTEADARAKMLIYLLENKLIQLENLQHQRTDQ